MYNVDMLFIFTLDQTQNIDKVVEAQAQSNSFVFCFYLFWSRQSPTLSIVDSLYKVIIKYKVITSYNWKSIILWGLIIIIFSHHSMDVTKMTTHYAPQKWPKWPVNDLLFRKNCWSWWPKKWPKWVLMMTPKMTKMTSQWLTFHENYLVMMTQKRAKMTTHDDPKNDQNDQSMTHFSGKLSGHDDPKNDQNDYSLWVIIGS